MIFAALAALSRRTTIAFAVGMALAVLAPPVTAIFGPGLAVWIFSMLTLSVVRTRADAIGRHVRRPARAAAVIFWMLIVSPLTIGSLILAFAPLPQHLIAPFIFYTAMPPLTAVPALAILFGIDAGLAVIVLMGASLLTPFILPLMVLVVLGIEVDIEVGELFQRLAILMFGSFAAGVAIRRVVGSARLARAAPAIDGVIVLTMVLIVVAVFDGVHATMLARPGLVAAIAGLVVLAAVFYQIASAILFLPFGIETALTAGMLSGNRNLAVILAVLGASATAEIALFVAVGQLPVYLLPMIQRPLARRFGFTND